jgi:hypothetical protein
VSTKSKQNETRFFLHPNLHPCYCFYRCIIIILQYREPQLQTMANKLPKLRANPLNKQGDKKVPFFYLKICVLNKLYLPLHCQLDGRLLRVRRDQR